mgnify:CR=1 FL=1
MNKFTDIFANFIEVFSFRQGSQDVKQVKKVLFKGVYNNFNNWIDLVNYAFLIPLNLRSPQFYNLFLYIIINI